MYQVQEPNLISNKLNCGNYKKKDCLKIEEKVDTFIEKIIFKKNKKINKGTIGLVSKFGSGKTFFMQYLFCKLKNESEYNVYPTYIDISKYENEYDRLLLFIFAEIRKSAKRKDFSNLINELFPIATRSFGRLITQKLTKMEELIDLAGEVSETIGNYLVESLDKEEVYNQKLQALSKEFPLVILIDNLDRCRPEFVLDFFVLVKRMFAVDNILFIVSYDKQQIINLLKTLYSDNIDISSYLRKYIAYEFYLPQEHNITEFTEKLCESYGYKKYNDIGNTIDVDTKIIDIAIKFWCNLYKNTPLSLRQHQHGLGLIIKIYSIVYESTINIINQDQDLKDICSLILLIYLKITYPYEYQNLYYFVLWKHSELDAIQIDTILNPLQKEKFEIDLDIAIKTLKCLSGNTTEEENNGANSTGKEDVQETEKKFQKATYSLSRLLSGKNAYGKAFVDLDTLKMHFQKIEFHTILTEQKDNK
jgi:hypothetical protein